jgi:hypothetical protein
MEHAIIEHPAMRFERPFKRTELKALVPAHLGEALELHLDRTLRIEILASVDERWEQINVLQLDGEPAMAGDVGASVKECADAHAMAVGRSGKYRAILVRDVGEPEQRSTTFEVDLELELQRLQRTPILWSPSSNPWVNLVERYHALGELMERLNDHAMERLSKQRRIRRDGDEAVLRALMGELVVLYQEGLRMQVDGAREVTEQRVQERLAQARAQLDAQIWETFAPLLEMAVARFWEAFEQQRSPGDAVGDADEQGSVSGAGGEALDAADERSAERGEGVPPSSGDAPSSGKTRSGA